jgi:hypothetical protein
MSARTLSTALALAACLGACSDPYNDSTDSRQRSGESDTPPGELPGRIPTRERQALRDPQAPAARSQRQALRHYAELVTNWTGADVERRFRAAARAAVGQARRDAEQTAASAGADPQLTGETASQGQFVAIARQPRGWALVITRERITPDAGPARYRIYRAHTTRVRGGVAVDAWEAQP